MDADEAALCIAGQLGWVGLPSGYAVASVDLVMFGKVTVIESMTS